MESPQNKYFKRYVNTQIRKNPLTPEEEQEIYRIIASTERNSSKHIMARDILIQSHFKFVLSIASDFLKLVSDRNPSISLDDLVSEGTLGFIKASENFDYTKGFKFISYAVFWISGEILDYLYNNTQIRIPQNVMNEVIKLKREEEKFFSSEIKNSSVPDSVLQARNVMYCMPFDSFRDGEFALENRISFWFSEKPPYEFDGEDVRESMRVLNQREFEVISLRYGLNESEKFMTLREVGKVFGLTRERIRQIEKRALRKLRKSLERGYREPLERRYAL